MPNAHRIISEKGTGVVSVAPKATVLEAAALMNEHHIGSIVVLSRGRGRVIVMADNPVFRAYWRGTERLLLNAIFFGPLTQVPGGSGEEGHEHE